MCYVCLVWLGVHELPYLCIPLKAVFNKQYSAGSIGRVMRHRPLARDLGHALKGRVFLTAARYGGALNKHNCDLYGDCFVVGT